MTITIAYQDLMLTVIALALAGIAVAVIWAAYRTSRVMREYEQLAPRVERLSVHADELLDHLAEVAEELRNLTSVGVRSVSGNGAGAGADHVDAALAMVRQLSALGIGLKSAVDAYQQKRSK